MLAKIKIKRFDPQKTENQNWYQTYEIDVPDQTTVLDGLIKIREEMDGTLALRCSCRASICGSCGMRVNGSAKLVCKTRISQVLADDRVVTVEPMANHAVIKDLVVELSTFFTQIDRIKPYLESTPPQDDNEHIASNESMVNLVTAMNCIMCGCCVSECTVLEVDDNFIGPAALAKAWRFVEDPRETTKQERLNKLDQEDGGIWDCTRCMQCVEVCPKDVAPMDRIMELREASIKVGNTKTAGYRHADSFVKSVKRHGRLDEARLAIESAGYFNLPKLIELAGIATKSLLKGKLIPPPFFAHNAKNRQNITTLIKNEDNKK